MKKVLSIFVFSIMTSFLFFGEKAEASKKDDTIYTGIFLDEISLGGMTKSQADKTVKEYVKDLLETPIEVIAADGTKVLTSPLELGALWVNQQIVSEAIAMCSESNVIERYKLMKDIENDKYVFTPVFTISDEKIRTFLEESIAVCDVPAVDNTIRRVDGAFEYVEGIEGCHLDTKQSVKVLKDYIVQKDYNKDVPSLVMVNEEPRGTKEELMQVSDILGSYSSIYITSVENRKKNISRGAQLANGVLLYPGDEFSSLGIIGPFTPDNGYFMASSYLNGKTVDGLGGGVCQFTSTLYNAVLYSELEVVTRSNHSMLVGYVPLSADAAVADTSNKDFVFKNSSDYPIYIESGTKNDNTVWVNIYGVETRPANRTLAFETEVLERIEPTTEVVYTDVKQPIGYIDLQTAHVGYKARLWKIVKIDGVEQSRERVNSSSYRMTPRSATVGVSTNNIDYYNEVIAAAGTNDIGHVEQVIANINSQIVASTPVQ